MAVRAKQPIDLQFRIERLFWFVAICYLVLVSRLVYLQAINGAYFHAKAQKMRAQTVKADAERGAVLDRDGKPMAVTIHLAELTFDPCKVTDPAGAAAILADVVGAPAPQIADVLGRKEVEGAPSRHSVKLPYTLNPESASALRAAYSRKGVTKAMTGITVKDVPQRSCLAGKEAVHVVGTVTPGKDNRPVGVMGIERSLNEVLKGSDGSVEGELDARRRLIPGTQLKTVEKHDGLDVKLTIDSTIQHLAEVELAACCDKYHPVGATAIVVDPKTGEVLALVSYPSFDPATRAELKGGQTEPLRNYALSLFEPGSTMKIITAAAALGENVITPETPFECSGHLTIGNRTVNCASHGGSSAHGHETIAKIIAHSCNVASAQIGMMVGMERLRKYLEAFGLLDQTGIELPSDMRGRLGFGADAQATGISKTSRVAFGQSVMVTPLAMAMAYAAIANHGVLMKPQLVSAYYDSSGKLVKKFAPVQVRQAIDPKLADYLVSLLEGVVTDGTAKVAAIPGYTVAGKTGTAQKVVKGQKGYARGKYVASFVGFLPARNPRAVVYVVVDEPQGAYYGAQVAAPVFQAIGQRLLWYWKVPPDDPASLNSGKASIAKL